MGKRKPARNDRKKKSHEQRYGMTAREWTDFKKIASKEDILAVRQKALKMLNK